MAISKRAVAEAVLQILMEADVEGLIVGLQPMEICSETRRNPPFLYSSDRQRV